MATLDLKTKRAEQRISQWEISKRTGIKQSKVSLIERGYVAPRASEKILIAGVLNTTVNKITWPDTSSLPIALLRMTKGESLKITKQKNNK